MSIIKLTSQEMKDIWQEDHPDYDMVEDVEWDDQGKYQYCYPVVQHIESGKFYTFCVQRSGSYFSDYDFDFPDSELTEVQKIKKVIETEKWVAVKE